jgi:hypothetical protein
MISKQELKEKTGYDSFLKFKRQCQRSSVSEKFIGLTKYYYGKNKVVDLDIKPEELFMMADNEISKGENKRKLIKH